MKKESFIFLVLILSAAIVSGYALALASCGKVIAEMETYNETITIANNNTEANQKINNVKSDVTPDTSVTIAENSKSSELLVVDPSEEEEIAGMMTAIGMSEGQDIEQFIKDFQEQNSLTPTGNLDSVTLNAIITQAKLQNVTSKLN